MTSDTCNCAPGNAVPTPNPRPSRPTGNTGRNPGTRCKKRRSRRAADRLQTPTYRLPIPPRLYDDARQKGFLLVDRGRRSSDVKLRCKTCQQIQQVRRSVLVNNAVECKNCLWMGRINDAMAVGATILTPDRGSHKKVSLALSCGHVVTRQYGRLAKAAQGGHALGCETCREARYVKEAEGSGWGLIGPSQNAKNGYRRYRHYCGHSQDHAIVNVENRQLDCASCGETWASKPSCIYLFQIEIADRTVLKLGYSSSPTRRLRQQLGDAARLTGKILRVIDLETGRAALNAEKKAHRKLRKTHPDLVVDAAVFADQINTKSEIYDLNAEPVIQNLMDQIDDASSGDRAAALPLTTKKAKVR
jgi:hypothetical protein